MIWHNVKEYYYLEYNSTIMCSSIFCSTSDLSGKSTTVPVIVALSNVNHFGRLSVLASLIPLNTFLSALFSFTPITSPFLTRKDGIFYAISVYGNQTVIYDLSCHRTGRSQTKAVNRTCQSLLSRRMSMFSPVMPLIFSALS